MFACSRMTLFVCMQMHMRLCVFVLAIDVSYSCLHIYLFMLFCGFNLSFKSRADDEAVDQKKYLEERCKPVCVKPLFEYRVIFR